MSRRVPSGGVEPGTLHGRRAPAEIEPTIEESDLTFWKMIKSLSGTEFKAWNAKAENAQQLKEAAARKAARGQ